MLKALLGLQEIDRRIFRVQEELKRLPRERDARAERLDKRVKILEGLTNEFQALRAKIKEIEDHTTIQRQRMRKIENEAASSRGDMALLAAYQHEIRTLKREIGNSEEEGLEFVERSDGIEAQMATLKAELTEEKATFDEFSGNVDIEVTDAESRLAALEADRQGRVSSELSPQTMELYTKLLVARDGEAMAQLEGSICQGCYMEIPPNLRVRLARASDIVQCPSCDRILFPPF